jgi:hypothetical protein
MGAAYPDIKPGAYLVLADDDEGRKVFLSILRRVARERVSPVTKHALGPHRLAGTRD